MASTKRPAIAGNSSPAQKKLDRERALTAGMAEMRVAAEKQRLKSEKLRQLRLERDAGLPAKKKPAARKAAATGLNLAETQKFAKK